MCLSDGINMRCAGQSGRLEMILIMTTSLWLKQSWLLDMLKLSIKFLVKLLATWIFLTINSNEIMYPNMTHTKTTVGIITVSSLTLDTITVHSSDILLIIQ